MHKYSILNIKKDAYVKYGTEKSTSLNTDAYKFQEQLTSLFRDSFLVF